MISSTFKVAVASLNPKKTNCKRALNGHGILYTCQLIVCCVKGFLVRLGKSDPLETPLSMAQLMLSLSMAAVTE